MSISAGVAKRFRELLILKGFVKINEFVEASGLSKTTIYSIASGKTLPRIDTIELICDKLGVDFFEFFSYARKHKVDYMVTINGREELFEVIDDLNEEEKKELENYINFLISKRKNKRK